MSRNDAFRCDTQRQDRCSFAAHTGKANPRSDLDAFGGTELRRMLRRAIQYGPEVTTWGKAAKASSKDPKLERELLFICYQSNIKNGFQFIQKSKFAIPTVYQSRFPSQ
jgi:deferrochelatase/peroxidase EfeB